MQSSPGAGTRKRRRGHVPLNAAQRRHDECKAASGEILKGPKRPPHPDCQQSLIPSVNCRCQRNLATSCTRHCARYRSAPVGTSDRAFPQTLLNWLFNILQTFWWERCTLAYFTVGQRDKFSLLRRSFLEDQQSACQFLHRTVNYLYMYISYVCMYVCMYVPTYY